LEVADKEHRMLRRTSLLALLLLAAVAVVVQAEEPVRGRQPHPLDSTLHKVINRGAYLFNGRDPVGCYRLWEGSLLMVRPMLADRPHLQKLIDRSLAHAQAQCCAIHSAFILRAALERIRDDLRGKDKDGYEPLSKEARAAALAKAARVGELYGVKEKDALVPEMIQYGSLRAGRFVVTRAQYAQYDKTYTYEKGTDNYPALVTPEEAKGYTAWLSKQTGKRFELPTAEEANLLYPVPPKGVKVKGAGKKEADVGESPAVGKGDTALFQAPPATGELAVDREGKAVTIGLAAGKEKGPLLRAFRPMQRGG
jgi:hypothetical protein